MASVQNDQSEQSSVSVPTASADTVTMSKAHSNKLNHYSTTEAVFNCITQVMLPEEGKLGEARPPLRPATCIIGKKCSQASKEILCLADLMEQALGVGITCVTPFTCGSHKNTGNVPVRQ